MDRNDGALADERFIEPFIDARARAIAKAAGRHGVVHAANKFPIRAR